MKIIEFDRNVLYEEVWNEPVVRVAEKYGVPGQDLRKQCVMLNVPLPPPGYWMKKKFGKSVEIIPLPEFDGPNTTNYTYLSAEERKSNRLLEGDNGDLISVPTELKKPHPLIKNAAMSAPGRGGRYYTDGRLYIVASNEQFRRTLLILDALFKTLERRGAILTNNNKRINIIIENAQVEILIKEKTQRVKHVKTEAELLAEAKGKPMWIPEFDYPFTGELTLTIDSPFAPKRNWKDNATKKIEANMNEIITSIFIAAEEIKNSRRIRDIELERIRKEREEKLQLENLKRYESERVLELEEKANDYKRAKLIREFLNELQTSLHSEVENKDEFKEYIAWAKAKADWIDPLKALDDKILGNKHKEWLKGISSSEEPDNLY